MVIIEEIYQKVYAEQEDVQRDDFSISDQLSVLMDETDIMTLDREKLGVILCKASLIGQKQGFYGGLRFYIRLLTEALA